MIAMHIANRKPALMCALTYFSPPIKIRLHFLTCIKVHLNILLRGTAAL